MESGVPGATSAGPAEMDPEKLDMLAGTWTITGSYKVTGDV